MPASVPDQPELTPDQWARVREHWANAGGSPVVVLAPAGSGRQTVWWVLTVLLAIAATAILSRGDSGFVPGAWAQNAAPLPPVAGARGIYAFTGQLTARTYGLFMMDVDNSTVWCYELQHGANGEPQLKLVAARSWLYDRFLEEFNVADPVPSAVKALVQQQRTGQAGGGNAPAAEPAVRVPGASE